MAGYLLNLAYVILLIAISPYLLFCALRKGKYREGWSAKFLGWVPVRAGDRPCVWIHAVSVGEVQLIGPVVQRLQEREPDWQCVISTTTRTGYALAREKYRGLTVFYCPLDFTWSIAAAMRRIRPDLLVLAELELWPNLIRAAHRRNCRIAVINGRLSEKSFRGYRRIRAGLTCILRKIDLIAVQNETYADRFAKLGAPTDRIHVTGSIKFDGAQADRDNSKTRTLRELARIAPDDVVLLAGSTQSPEESIVLATFQTLHQDYPQLRLVLVPRHLERFEDVAQLLARSGIAWQRRSELRKDVTPDPDARILLVDSIGELGAWWGTAAIGFVGGSLGSRGGQNMIEPAAYGVAICFGPNTHNFRDVVAALRATDAAVVVHDESELTALVRHYLDEPAVAHEQGKRAAALVAENRGATERTIELLVNSA